MKMDMMVDRQNQALLRLLDELHNKSSVFFYNNNTEAKKFVITLAEEVKNIDSLPVINICWNQNDKLAYKEAEDNFVFYLFKNFTNSMIKIVKLISEKKSLIILADMSSLEMEENTKPYVHFFSTLLRKSSQYESTLITLVNEEMIEAHLKDELIPYFDNIFLLDERRITKMPDKSLDLLYNLQENLLHVEPFLQADMNKIKEIFSLSAEEKEELDKIVGQSLEEYRTSM
jgi:hypothetical protein